MAKAMMYIWMTFRLRSLKIRATPFSISGSSLGDYFDADNYPNHDDGLQVVDQAALPPALKINQ